MSSVKTNNNTNSIELPYYVVAIDLRAIVACDDPEYQERQQDFINRAYGLKKEVDEETERLTANNIDTLADKREAKVIQCKEALANFNETMLQRAYYENRERALNLELNRAGLAVRVKRDSPLQPTYSTKADIAQWESELAELQAAQSAKMSECENHSSLMGMWVASCQRLKAIHDSLAVEESEIRHRLDRLRGVATGPERDRATGLTA
jgi:hypothetical protein